MPTIVLTSRIDRTTATPAKGSGGRDPVCHLAWEDLIYIADLFLTGDDHIMSLRGGEPTRHPHFLDMTAFLLEKGFGVRIFTNGEVDDVLLKEMSDYLDKFPVERISFYLSMEGFAENSISPEKESSVRRLLDAMGSKVVPTLSLNGADFSLEPVVNLINEYNLHRALHLTLAQPVPGRQDQYLESDEIEGAVFHLFTFAELMDRFKVRIDLDCTFMPCAFSDKHLAHLMRTTPGFSFTACRPGITVGPDMTVWSCWTLPGFSRRSIFEFDSFQKIMEYIWSHHGAARSEVMGAFIECDTCRMRVNNVCYGGCLAHSLQGIAAEHPGLRDVALSVPIKIEEVTDER